VRLRKPKRRIYELRPGKTGWILKLRGGWTSESMPWTKKEAVRRARVVVKRNAPSQLLIFTLKGRIEKGGKGEASYEADSPRRPG
jgi:hypothetical protein